MPAALHQDPGLQPERTSLAWGRTMMALITVSAIFLRWLPLHGFPVLALFTVSVASAGTIYFTQRRRYRASSHGISTGRLGADAAAVLWTTTACLALGCFGIAVVVTG